MTSENDPENLSEPRFGEDFVVDSVDQWVRLFWIPSEIGIWIPKMVREDRVRLYSSV